MLCPPIPRLYWFQVSTGALTNATPTTLAFDASAIRKKHQEVLWWRISSIVGFRDATATMGNLILTNWIAEPGYDLSQSVCFQPGFQLCDTEILFPRDWNGRWTVLAENRTGATGTFLMSFALEPLFAEELREVL